MHSLRHTLPTCARQLGLDGETTNTMGGWAGAFPMPARYGSVACVSELLPKAFVVKHLAAGWRPSPRGSLLSPPVFAWGAAAAAPAASEPLQALTVSGRPFQLKQADSEVVPFVPCSRFAGKNSDFAELMLRDAVFVDDIVQCYHITRRIMHLHSEGDRSLCGNLVAKNGVDIVADICVSESVRSFNTSDSSCGFCLTCYSRCITKVVVSEPRESILDDSSSGSSAGTESDSSQSDRAGEAA